jgi:hypothetical protein
MTGKTIARRIARLQEHLLPPQGPVMGYRLVEVITGRVLSEVQYSGSRLILERHTTVAPVCSVPASAALG